MPLPMPVPPGVGAPPPFALPPNSPPVLPSGIPGPGAPPPMTAAPNPGMLAALLAVAGQKNGGQDGALKRAMDTLKGKMFPQSPGGYPPPGSPPQVPMG